MHFTIRNFSLDLCFCNVLKLQRGNFATPVYKSFFLIAHIRSHFHSFSFLIYPKCPSPSRNLNGSPVIGSKMVWSTILLNFWKIKFKFWLELGTSISKIQFKHTCFRRRIRKSENIWATIRQKNGHRQFLKWAGGGNFDGFLNMLENFHFLLNLSLISSLFQYVSRPKVCLC